MLTEKLDLSENPFCAFSVSCGVHSVVIQSCSLSSEVHISIAVALRAIGNAGNTQFWPMKQVKGLKKVHHFACEEYIRCKDNEWQLTFAHIVKKDTQYRPCWFRHFVIERRKFLPYERIPTR